MKKLCVKCNVEKEKTLFNKFKSSKDGLQSYCKECCKIIDKEYKLKNKEKLKEKQLEYYSKNIHIVKNYYLKNKEKLKEKQKIYNSNNVEKKKEYAKKYRSDLDNKEKQRKKASEWRDNNREYVRKSRANYMKEYRKKSPTYRLRENIGHYIRQALIDSIPKSGTYKKYLGCSITEYRQYLEKLFKPEMTWENYGIYWEIDHIKAISNFDLTNEEEILKAFCYLNTQPLSIKENRQKSNK
jgi:hypothetical protein